MKNKEKMVYIISNPAWEGWYKVGVASKWKSRLGQYQTSSPFRDYKLEYGVTTDDWKAAEKNIHDSFEGHREWVKADLEKLKSKLKNINNNLIKKKFNMKNTVLVNVAKENKPWGFWHMEDSKATSVKYLASHDNHGIVDVFRISRRFKVKVLQEFDQAGDIQAPNRKIDEKWTFHLEKLEGFAEASALEQLESVDLYQVQGVVYADVQIPVLV